MSSLCQWDDLVTVGQWIADSRSISFWRLDKTRLTAAVGHFSPDVAVLDRT